MTLAELGERMSAREFLDWQTFDSLEPIGGERIDLAAGIVAATIANANRDPRKGKAFRPADFMPLSPKPPPATDGGLADFLAWAREHNRRLETEH